MKEERRAGNRLSAFQSRKRRTTIIEDLQRTVTQLSNDITKQNKTIAEANTKVSVVTDENAQLRLQLAAYNGSADCAAPAVIGTPSSSSSVATVTSKPLALNLRALLVGDLAFSGFLLNRESQSDETIRMLNELAVIEQQQALLRKRKVVAIA